MGEPDAAVDVVADMEREPGTRPVCARLTEAQIKALRLRRGKSTGLKARRLVCPGPGFALTPMGAQWREYLIENARMKRALLKAIEMLKRGAKRQSVLEVLVGGLG